MRPASRLFQFVQLVRGRRLTTAAFLAQRLEVTVRTVYRDVAQLQRQGVPIEGEAGVGYRLGAGFELPPLMFRTVRPLGCFYWGKVWTFSAWCELRGDFRGFRVDRIESIGTLDARFRDEAGRTLADFLRKVDRGAA